ncbi:MAG TPA: TetR/AcrR family transcriptional regulator [Candidatus Acidoferrales bacterium]|nr:TetR/AcrR family transcriptional regulator [Candidatus Acidoferrales bacterium]
MRDGILQTAETIFTQRDYHEVLMDDVASTANVSKGTLYRYFPSKGDLYLAVMFEGLDRLQVDLRQTLAKDVDPLDKIELLIRCMLGHFWDRRFFFALLHRNEHKPDDRNNREWLQRREELSRIFQRAIREAVAAGDLRQLNPRVATEMLLGMLRGANRYRTTHDTLDRTVAAVFDLFIRGAGTAITRRTPTARNPRDR